MIPTSIAAQRDGKTPNFIANNSNNYNGMKSKDFTAPSKGNVLDIPTS